MKYFFSLFLFFISFSAFAQRELGVFEIDDKIKSNDAYFIEHKDGTYDLLFNANFLVRRAKLDQNFGLTVFETFRTSKMEHGSLLGNSIDNDETVYLYYKFGKNLYAAPLQSGVDIPKFTKLDLDLKKRAFLGHVIHNNIFYVFTINDDARLKIYELSGLDHTSSTMDLSSIRGEDEQGDMRQLDDVLTAGSKFNWKAGTVEVISNDVPNDIRTASQISKLYHNGDIVHLTTDRAKYKTIVIEISLSTYKFEVKEYNKPLDGLGDDHKTNSFLYDGKIFQSALTDDKLRIHARDMASNVVLNTYEAHRDEEITFNNTGITQEGGAFSKIRDLENTSQLFRKMNAGVPGLSVYGNEKGYEMTFGGYKLMPQANSSSMMGGFGGVALGGGSPVMFISYSPILNSFYSYDRVKSTYTIGLFDKQFNHIEGEVPKNIFDRMNDYTSGKRVSTETVHKFRDNFLYGYLDLDTSRYHLVSFEP